MSQFTQKYALVQFFGDVKEGTTYPSSEWPLHSTVVDTFSVDWSVELMITRLTESLSGHAIANSAAGDDTYLGENGQVQVVLIDKTDSLTALHLDVLATLKQGGIILNDPQFAHDGFLPHATVQKDTRLNKGDKVQFRALSIVDMFPDKDPYKRKVLKTIEINSL